MIAVKPRGQMSHPDVFMTLTCYHNLSPDFGQQITGYYRQNSSSRNTYIYGTSATLRLRGSSLSLTAFHGFHHLPLKPLQANCCLKTQKKTLQKSKNLLNVNIHQSGWNPPIFGTFGIFGSIQKSTCLKNKCLDV